jgi:hypothetical protein
VQLSDFFGSLNGDAMFGLFIRRTNGKFRPGGCFLILSLSADGRALVAALVHTFETSWAIATPVYKNGSLLEAGGEPGSSLGAAK